jgi:cobalt/nickel transport protein
MTSLTSQSGPIRISLAMALMSAAGAHAHFQELIPSTDIVNAETGNALTLQMRFTHPMEQGPLMTMGEPVQVGVLSPNGREDLKSGLEAADVDGKRTYRLDYKIKQPGDYVFYLDPAPYWEPAEGTMIVHYTKVVVDAYGAEEGWDADLGLPVEIEPLVRPYGLWAGNLFQGIVKRGGKAVPFAEVEVEWRNDGSITPPSDPYITQVIKADANGVFSYAMPKAGWWGFAALLAGDEPMKNPDGEAVPVELGALIWIYTREMR